MKSLTKEEKDLILDFYFRCGTDLEIDKGRDMVVVNPRAAEFYYKLEGALCTLDSVKYEPCPDNLADLTIAKLNLAAVKEKFKPQSQENIQLKTLLESEQAKTAAEISVNTKKIGLWRNFAEVAAIAAMIFIILSISFPSLFNMRQKAWQQQCTANMANVGRGMVRYANDNDGRLPAVATVAGSPWWKVGDQGQSNHSNTRHFWKLVKEGYVDGKDFICPGRKDAKRVDYTQQQLAGYNDFPSRRHVGYSFIFMCDKAQRNLRTGKINVLMADLNPVFERVLNSDLPKCQERDEFTKILLDKKMLSMMSTNHRGRGQNLLLQGGSAAFKKHRIILNDDIYTVRGINSYSGREIPCDEKDTFLAP